MRVSQEPAGPVLLDGNGDAHARREEGKREAGRVREGERDADGRREGVVPIDCERMSA